MSDSAIGAGLPEEEVRELSHGAAARRGGRIIVLGQAGKLSIQFASLVVLSRLLTPVDFGLVAMLAVFIALGELVRDFGLTQAALQTEHLSDEQSSQLFWTNVILASVLALVLVAVLPLIEMLFSEPRLGPIGMCLALVFVVNALQSQSFVVLARDGRYIAMTLTDVVAQSGGFLVAVVCAIAGAGYWALVAQVLSAACILAGSRIVLARFRPSRPRRAQGMGKLYRYGVQLGAAQLLTYASGNADNFVVGVSSGATSLGLYSRAFQLVSVPLGQLLAPLTSAVLPVLSRNRQSHGHAHELLLKAQVAMSTALTLPLVLFAALSEPIVELVLGREWDAASPIARILLYGACFQVLLMVAFWAFLTSGLTRELLVYNVVTKPMHVGLIVVGSTFGLEGVAWGYVCGLVVSWPISLAWLSHYDRLPWRRFVRAAGLVGLAGSLCGVTTGVAYDWLGGADPSYADGIAAATAGGVIYLVVVCTSRQTRLIVRGSMGGETVGVSGGGA